MCCLGLPPAAAAAAAVLGRAHRGIYLPFSSLLAARTAGTGCSVGQHAAVGCSWQFPGSHPGAAAQASTMAVLLLLWVLHHSWAGAYSFCCFLCSVLPGTSPAAPPAHSPAFLTLQGGCAALGMRVIPAGKVPVLSLAGQPGEQCWVTLPCTPGPASTGAPEAS